MVGTLADFLGALSISEWITGGISILALIISALGYRQRERQFAKPQLTFEWAEWRDKLDPESTEWQIPLTVFNDGDAPARAVKLWFVGALTSHGHPHHEWDEIAPGKGEKVLVPYPEGDRAAVMIRMSRQKGFRKSRSPRRVNDGGP